MVGMTSGDNTSLVQNTLQNEVIWGRLLQPIILTLTYGRHSTDAESRSWGREAELIQYCVGPCRIDHCNIAAEGRARNDPHRTLAEKDGYGVWKDEWHKRMRPRETLVMVRWDCIWWLDQSRCYFTGMMSDLPCCRLRFQVWPPLHSLAEQGAKVRGMIRRVLVFVFIVFHGDKMHLSCRVSLIQHSELH